MWTRAHRALFYHHHHHHHKLPPPSRIPTTTRDHPPLPGDLPRVTGGRRTQQNISTRDPGRVFTQKQHPPLLGGVVERPYRRLIAKPRVFQRGDRIYSSRRVWECIICYNPSTNTLLVTKRHFGTLDPKDSVQWTYRSLITNARW